jgi:multidrug efflux pump subunit AcrA (membrane-fusion protein)
MEMRFAGTVVLATILGACSSHPTATPAPTAVPVKVGQVHRIQAPATVPVSGSVVSPDNPSNVAFLVPGKAIHVGPREGDYVKRGQVLAAIDPTDYALGVRAAVAQVAAARAVLQKVESPVRPELLEQARVAFERSQDEYRRMKQVYEAKSLPPNDFEKFRAAYEASRQQYEQARAGGQKEDRAQAQAAFEQAEAAEEISRKHLADATLTAPVDGFVANRSIEVGDMASAGRPVFQIVQLDPVEISVGVPETDIHLVRAGQKATVQIPALPGDKFQGVVRTVNVAADPSTRTYMVRIAVPNPRHALRLGMIAEAQIRGDRQLDLMTVPADAIVQDPQGASMVFVCFPDQGRVYSRRVEVGTVYGTEVEIRNGLSGAESLVVAGQSKLRDGSAVAVVERAAPGAPARGPEAK